MQRHDFATCIEVSKRVRWDIEKDLLRDRGFDLSKKFLPDGISGIHELEFLSEEHARFLSQIQGRTYANMFGFVERFITAKILEITRNHWLDDQVALEALVRFCDEELKHQELFRRIESMLAPEMPEGYTFLPDPNEVAAAVLSRSTWAVLALILEIELFTQEHYKQSIAKDQDLCPLYKDVFLYHWKEETTHAIMDELEWPRENERITLEERDRAVDELIGLIADVDGILRAQSEADADYFLHVFPGEFDEDRIRRIREGILKGYRRQYIFSGVEHPRYRELMASLITREQALRIGGAMAPLM